MRSADQAGQDPLIVAPAHCGCELLAMVVPSMNTCEASAKIAPPVAAVFHVIDPLWRRATEPFSAARPPPLPPVALPPVSLPPAAPVALPVRAEPSNSRPAWSRKAPPPSPPSPAFPPL